MLNTTPDLAKYPFTKESRNYVKGLELGVDELLHQDFSRVVNRAERRVEEALIEGEVAWRGEPHYEVEAISYPVAVMLVASIDDGFLERRYALAEAKRVYHLLNAEEKPVKLIEIAESSFNWRALDVSLKSGLPYRYALDFFTYLSSAKKIRGLKWKLVNHLLTNGMVYLRRDEFARLISEEAQKHFYRTITSSPKIDLHPLMIKKLDRINRILSERKERIRVDELPEVSLASAYPPCISRLYDNLTASRHLSHMGRFTLTSFLLHIGVEAKRLFELYQSVSDFDDRLTRYQIEHIAGKRGSGRKYLPPNCDTLKTHGLCPETVGLCESIKNPLSYYRRKLRSTERKGKGA